MQLTCEPTLDWGISFNHHGSYNDLNYMYTYNVILAVYFCIFKKKKKEKETSHIKMQNVNR